MSTRSGLAAVGILVLAMTAATTRADGLGGVGALGDSITDEYQFEPGRGHARNWLELLAEHRGVDFGAFSEASRGEPRKGGYAYNWARSDATTRDMIAQGQHTGLARQVARGEVKVVCIFIGGNDFIGALKSGDREPDLEGIVAEACRNVDLALEAILAASPDVRVVLVTVPDVCYLPEFAAVVRSGGLPTKSVANFTRAIRRYNDHLRAAAKDKRVAIADLFRWGEWI